MFRDSGEFGYVRRASLGVALLLGSLMTSACGDLLDEDAPPVSGGVSAAEIGCAAVDSAESMTAAERLDQEIQTQLREEMCSRVRGVFDTYQTRENADITGYDATRTSDTVRIKYIHDPTNTHFSAAFGLDDMGRPDPEDPRAFRMSRVVQGTNRAGGFAGTDEYIIAFDEQTNRYGLDDVQIINDSVGVRTPQDGLEAFDIDPGSVPLERLQGLQVDVSGTLLRRDAEIAATGTM